MSETDLELLARYRREQAEDAFAEIVHRHLGLVYSAALRQVGSPQLAEEVAQSVFTDLALNARRLASGTILTAWLYQVACRTAIDVVRRESRRRSREQVATEMDAMNAAVADWTNIEPLLDEAMQALEETDRAAVLLRYFENKSLREVGESLGASEDAAQKRVSRAVERLREFFTKRGVTVAAGGLALVISSHAVQAAPEGLGAVVTAAASVAGKTSLLSAIATSTKTIAMTTLQKTLVTVAVVAAFAAGSGAYVAHRHNASRDQADAETELPKASWTNAGFATPQATLRTLGWSLINGDRERFKQALLLTDPARSMLEEMITNTPGYADEVKHHPELLDMKAEDSIMFPMMAQNKKNPFTGYRIVSQQSRSADEKILNVETETASGTPRGQNLKFQRVGHDWKVVYDEASLAIDYQKMQRLNARR